MANLMEQRKPARVGPRGSGADPSGRRLDIQALRAFAVTAVVLFHLGLGLDGGFIGVDVFFVISGFLITSHLANDFYRTRHVRFVDFYANRARRLLPAASAVLIVTIGLTLAFLPPVRWGSAAWDVVSSALYVENWHLAATSVNYLTQDVLPSPLQHFWSLSVEEQFYLLWPAVIAFVGWVLRRVAQLRNVSQRAFVADFGRRGLLIGLASITAPSFICSIIYTRTNAGAAYFVTPTRLWELAVGGFLAIWAPKLSRKTAILIGWLGVLGIAASLLLIRSNSEFPGYWAALPTIATAAVIAAGADGSLPGLAYVFRTRTVQWLGGISYSVYLWHWPLIVAATARWGSMNATRTIVIIAVTLIVSHLSWRFIENPPRRSAWWRDHQNALRASSLAIAVTLLCAALLGMKYQSEQAAELARSEPPIQFTHGLNGTAVAPAKIGAEVLPANPRDAKAGEPVKTSNSITPAPSKALSDWANCNATPIDSSDVRACTYGATRSSTRIAVVGDSHAEQWIPALTAIAEKHGWSVTAYIHFSCPFADGSLTQNGKRYAACIAWNASVRETLAANPPTALITTDYTNTSHVAGPAGTLARAYERAWAPLLSSKIPVIALRDTPAPFINVPECVSEHPEDLTKCAVPRASAMKGRGTEMVAAAQADPRVTLVDLDDAVCPTEQCAPVIGGVLVYRDTNHITATYSASLAQRLESQLVTVPALNNHAVQR